MIKLEHIKKIDWIENKIFLAITIDAVEKSMIFNDADYLPVQTKD